MTESAVRGMNIYFFDKFLWTALTWKK